MTDGNNDTNIGSAEKDRIASEVYLKNANALLNRISEVYGTSVDGDLAEGFRGIPRKGTDNMNMEFENGDILSGSFQLKGDQPQEDLSSLGTEGWMVYTGPDGDQVQLYSDGDLVNYREPALQEGEFRISYHDMESGENYVHRGSLEDGPAASWLGVKDFLDEVQE
ncbi:hypothetical protein [Candidatus Nanohalococcus occultus]|uniref:Uncharacterized protein n=1 Tax=Candidatus Nanohalococcus occultus TaxID=2978047 RepID=A0ABY8CF90_9ARCH|nr:hypothetical protein SVXNc_0851 [Candidatus Nanohaloarchaeota archaeon SVXNc]